MSLLSGGGGGGGIAAASIRFCFNWDMVLMWKIVWRFAEPQKYQTPVGTKEHFGTRN